MFNYYGLLPCSPISTLPHTHLVLRLPTLTHVQSNVSKAQAEEERIFLINIKELIARVRHNPINEEDFFTEFEVSLRRIVFPYV